MAYLLVNLIRFALMFGAYPILSRIGLKWNVKEAIFVSFGGLRGAIAIALAISLDSELRRDTAPGDPRREQGKYEICAHDVYHVRYIYFKLFLTCVNIIIIQLLTCLE